MNDLFNQHASNSNLPSQTTKLESIQDLNDMVSRLSNEVYSLGMLAQELMNNDTLEAPKPVPNKRAHSLTSQDRERIKLITNQWLTLDVMHALLGRKKSTVHELLWKLRRNSNFTVDARSLNGRSKMYHITEVAA